MILPMAVSGRASGSRLLSRSRVRSSRAWTVRSFSKPSTVPEKKPLVVAPTVLVSALASERRASSCSWTAWMRWAMAALSVSEEVRRRIRPLTAGERSPAAFISRRATNWFMTRSWVWISLSRAAWSAASPE